MAMRAAKGPIGVRASSARRTMVATPTVRVASWISPGSVTMSKNLVSAVGASLVVAVMVGIWLRIIVTEMPVRKPTMTEWETNRV